jgi:hypothetical protein
MPVAITDAPARQALLRRGLALEHLTLAWNVIGIVGLAVAAIWARSVALAGFGLDSLIEIGASVVVIWELSGTGQERQRLDLRLIGCAFAASQPATRRPRGCPARGLSQLPSAVLAVANHPSSAGLQASARATGQCWADDR